jgi:O-antigen/teichoic acid export membrane protein
LTGPALKIHARISRSETRRTGLGDEDYRSAGKIQKLIAVGRTVPGAFGFMTLAYTVSSALNYLFSIIMTRMLGDVGAFASYNSLNSILLIVGMAVLSVQTVVAKYVVEFEASGERNKIRYLVHDFSRWLIGFALLVLGISIAAAWPLSHALKLESPVLVITVGASLAILFYLTLAYGLLQGQQKFLWLGTASITSSVLRVILGVTLVALGAGVYGAVGASVLSSLIVAALIVYYYRDYYKGKVERAEDFHPAQALRALIPVSIAIFLVIFMTQIDVVLVKALKGVALADAYSYGALAGKAVLFFPAGIALVMFPRVSELKAKNQPTRRILGLSLAACLILEGAVLAFYALFPGFTATVFAGAHGKSLAAYKGIAGLPFVVLFGLVMAVFAFVNLLVYYQLALDRRFFIAVLAAGAALEVAGIMLFHSTLTDVLLVMLVVAVVLLVANIGLALAPSTSARNIQAIDFPPEVAGGREGS